MHLKTNLKIILFSIIKLFTIDEEAEDEEAEDEEAEDEEAVYKKRKNEVKICKYSHDDKIELFDCEEAMDVILEALYRKYPKIQKDHDDAYTRMSNDEFTDMKNNFIKKHTGLTYECLEAEDDDE